MIPFHKGDPSAAASGTLFLNCLAVTCPHFGRTFLAAKGTAILSKVTFAVGTFIKIGTVELVVAVEGTQKSTHNLFYSLINYFALLFFLTEPIMQERTNTARLTQTTLAPAGVSRK